VLFRSTICFPDQTLDDEGYPKEYPKSWRTRTSIKMERTRITYKYVHSSDLVPSMIIRYDLQWMKIQKIVKGDKSMAVILYNPRYESDPFVYEISYREILTREKNEE